MIAHPASLKRLLLERTSLPMAVASAALMLAAHAPASAQSAGQNSLTLYDQPDYRGASATFYGDNAEVASTGFARSARSAQVRGTWRVCSAGSYVGHCEVLSRNVRDLSTYGLDGRVGSAQLLSAPTARAYTPAPYNPAPYGRDGYAAQPAYPYAAAPYPNAPAPRGYDEDQDRQVYDADRGQPSYGDQRAYDDRGRPDYDAQRGYGDQRGYDDERGYEGRGYDDRRGYGEQRGYGGSDESWPEAPRGGYGAYDAPAPYDAGSPYDAPAHDNGYGRGRPAERYDDDRADGYDRSADGSRTQFFAHPALRGRAVPAGRGAADAFCRAQGLGSAVYAGEEPAPDDYGRSGGGGEVLSDVLCRR